MVKIILLRGLAREIGHWGSFLTILRKKLPQHDLVPLEIPGAGTLRDIRSPLNIEEYVHFLRNIYIQHNPDKTPSLFVGLSFGGMIAVQWSLLYPEDFRGSILLNISGRPLAFYRRLTPAAVSVMVQALFCKSNYVREKKIADLICNTADTKQIAEEWSLLAQRAPIKPLNLIHQLIAATRFRRPAHIRVPTLLLNSRKDRMVSPECSEKLSKDWGVIMRSHPSAGHDLTTDAPHWVAQEIKEWIKSI